MTRESIQELGAGLLARLRLSPAEASVLFDARVDRTLRVFVYSREAYRRLTPIKEWHGFQVCYIGDVELRPYS
jgi:hypothetical protein